MFVFNAPYAHAGSGASYRESAPRFSFAPETSGRQVMDAEHHETRKRRNADHSISSIRGFTAQPWTGTSSTLSQFESPAPLTHDRYTLAGGSIEGTSSFTPQNGNYDDYFNLQTQRGMWSLPASPSIQPRDRLTSPSDGPNSWVVDSLLNLVGGVAGKLFQFCTVPFRGFQAGGGQSYDADAQIKIASKLGLHDEPEPPEPPEPAAPVQQIKFDPHPAHDYGVRSIDSIDSERPRMPKRLRTEDAWVMVSPAETSSPSAPTPPSTYTSTTTPRLPSRRTSLIPRPQSRTTTPSRRASLIPISRRTPTSRTPFHTTALPSPTTTTYTHTPPSTSTTAKRPPSRLSLSSSSPNKDRKKPIPLPLDTQRLVSRLRKEELEDDARLRRMSSQMTAMLREAREALGTRVEVEIDADEDMG